MKTNITTIIITLIFTFQIHAQTLNQEITKDGDTPFFWAKLTKAV